MDNHQEHTIGLNIKVNVLPKNHREFVQLSLSVIQDCNNDPGCVSYSLHRDLREDNAYHLESEWKSRPEMEQHISSQNFGALLGALHFLSNSHEIRIHELSYAGGKEVIHNVRSHLG